MLNIFIIYVSLLWLKFIRYFHHKILHTSILGMSKFYMWMTKCLVINTTFMSKLNYVKLSIHNAILLSPLSSQFKTELGTFIENSSYSKLLKKLFIPLESKPCFLQAEGGEYGWH